MFNHNMHIFLLELIPDYRPKRLASPDRHEADLARNISLECRSDDGLVCSTILSVCLPENHLVCDGFFRQKIAQNAEIK